MNIEGLDVGVNFPTVGLYLPLGTENIDPELSWALSEHFGVETKDGVLIDPNLTHDTLAAMVGITRSFFSTTIKQLEHSGLVHSEQRRIVIRDPALLKACTHAGGPASTARSRKARPSS